MPHLTGSDRELIEKSPSVKILHNRMVIREGKSEQTLKRYLDGIRKFTAYMKADSPDNALTLFSASKDRTLQLDGFVDYLLGQNRSAINLKAQFFGVKKWFIANRVNSIDWEFISRPKVASNIKDRIPTVEELRLILDNKVTLRDKAFYMVTASAGFRIGTALSLTVKDYKPIEELGMITVDGGEGRKLAKGRSYFTFITPEARRLLEQYLATRTDATPDAPLFVKTAKGSGNKFAYTSNVSRQWTILVKRARLLERIPGQRGYTLHGHTLRKFFQTHCKLSGCRADFVDFWMGHTSLAKSEYLNDSYFRPELQVHLAEYRKAVSSLQIFEVDRKEIEKAKGDIEQLKRQNELLQTKMDTIQNSKGSLETLLNRVIELEKKLGEK
jgi:integrase